MANPDATVASGTCYRYRYSIADNVGNRSATVTASVDAKVDTSAPAAAVLAPSELTGTGAQYYDGATKTHYFRPGGAGSFTLNASASDAQSDIASVAFPDVSAVSGWTGSTGGSDTTSPYASPVTYAWTAGASAPGGADHHGDQQRGAHRPGHDHDHRGLDRPERPDARARGRALLHLALGLADGG